MKYITFFDLLGTRGFCDNPDKYYNNICCFEKAIKETAWILKDYGTVGMFSDSAYAESTDLKILLDFLVQLRNRLISENLFFNAVVKSGKLDIDSIEKLNHPFAFGVSFKNSNIAELYIAQTKFKGIGIYIDDSVQADVAETGYRLIDCIFVQKKEKLEGNEYSPVSYKDISFDTTIHSKKSVERLMKIILRAMYSSYMKSPKFGVYYVSLLANLIRSYTDNFDWDLSKHEFTSSPLPFNIINKVVKNHYNELSELTGLEYLALILLDVVYNSPQLNDAQKNDITLEFTKYSCINKKYLHCLENLPINLFTYHNENDTTNKEVFIKYCQDEMSDRFVDKVIG